MTETSPAGSGDPRGGTSLHLECDDGLTLTIDSPSTDTIVIEVRGELDMLTAPELLGAVRERLDEWSTIVLALDGVVFLGTSGLAALIEMREHTQRTRTTLRLVCTERRVLRPLGIAGLHHLFDIRDSVHEAVSGDDRPKM